jgi:hypothetical protein
MKGIQYIWDRYRYPKKLILRNDDGVPYVTRWYLIPRNQIFNLYLHKFTGDDDDRALHDHEYDNISIPIKAGYIEHNPEFMPTECDPIPSQVASTRCTFRIIRRSAEWPHRICCKRDQYGNLIPAWSLFVGFRRRRDWGFWTQLGWVNHDLFLREPYNPIGDRKQK